MLRVQNEGRGLKNFLDGDEVEDVGFRVFGYYPEN